jgi:class 3 adenylate cyclase
LHTTLKYRPLLSGLLVWLLISWIPSYAQNDELDSLKSLLDNSKVDTVQVKILNEISYSILNQDPNETIKYGIQARDMSDMLGYGSGKAYALKNMGLGYYYLGDYLKVLDYWSQSLESFEAEKDTAGIANMLNNLGAIYYTQGSNSKAIEFFLRSLRIAENLGDTLRIASALVNVGGLYSDNEKDYDKALLYLWQVGHIAEAFPLDDQSLGGYLTGIGEIYKNTGDYDSALFYLEKALPLYENTVRIPEALIRLGMVHEERGEFDTAIQYQKQAYRTAVETDQNLFVTRSLLNLGNIYRKTGNLSEAHKVYNEAEQHALEGGLNYELRDIYQGQSLTFAQQRSFEQAYKFNTQFQAIKDTLFNLETDDKVRGLQFTYEIDKKEDQIDLLEKDAEIAQLENRRQKIISRASGVVGILLLLLAIGLYQRFKYVRKTKRIIENEKQRSEDLLLNILPEETADELKENGETKARSYEKVSILFTDFKGFTSIAAKMSPEELVQEIHQQYKVFDEIMSHHGIEKIKTIGDAYMAAGGLPIPNDTNPMDVVKAALEIRDYVSKLKEKKIREGKPYFEIRIGIHTGPVVAGVVGIKKFAYDIWGDTVNIASRMESNSEPGKVNISQSTYDLVKDQAICSYRGEIEAKNRGMLKMYFVENLRMPVEPTTETSGVQETLG